MHSGFENYDYLNTKDKKAANSVLGKQEFKLTQNLRVLRKITLDSQQENTPYNGSVHWHVACLGFYPFVFIFL